MIYFLLGICIVAATNITDSDGWELLFQLINSEL
jgi:hypothetical protein